MPVRILAIAGSAALQGHFVSVTKWLVGSAQASHGELEAELINLADKKVGFTDGRTVEQYQDDTAGIIESVRVADGIIIVSWVDRRSFAAALKNLIDRLPIVSLAGKPIGIVAMGASAYDFLGVDWHLGDVLAWFGARVVPTSVYLAPTDFVDGDLTRSTKRDLEGLVDAVIGLKETASTVSSWLGQKLQTVERLRDN